MTLTKMDPVKPTGGGDGSIEIPNWTYGVIAGAGTAILGGVITTYHILSRRKRVNAAKKVIEQHKADEIERLTPRGNNVPTLGLPNTDVDTPKIGTPRKPNEVVL